MHFQESIRARTFRGFAIFHFLKHHHNFGGLDVREAKFLFNKTLLTIFTKTYIVRNDSLNNNNIVV